MSKLSEENYLHVILSDVNQTFQNLVLTVLLPLLVLGKHSINWAGELHGSLSTEAILVWWKKTDKKHYRSSEIQPWMTKTAWPLTAVVLAKVSSMQSTRRKGFNELWCHSGGGQKTQHPQVKVELGRKWAWNTVCLDVVFPVISH